MNNKCSLTRVGYFSAGHRLYNTRMSPQENRQLYGQCSNYHGHNYKLEVTVTGEICPTTGMVMNVGELKEIVQKRILDIFDHKNIHTDVKFFRDGHISSTAENIAVFIWNTLRPHIAPQLQLEIKLHETKKNIVTYMGQL